MVKAKAKDAEIDPRETYPKRVKIATKVISGIKSQSPIKPAIAPTAVANPFPPLKRSQGVKVCPSIAEIAARLRTNSELEK